MNAIDLAGLIRLLSEGGVEFIIVGGVAATVHGSAHANTNLDIVYQRTRENVERLAACLAPIRPYLRGAPEGLPFQLDAATIRRGLNFTLRTTLGDLDLLGEIAGGGGYDGLIVDTDVAHVFNVEVKLARSLKPEA